MDIFRKTRLSDVSFSSLYSLYKSIMNEGVLLLCLHQAIPLCPDVLEEGKHIHIPSCDNLLQYGMNNYVAPSAANTSTENIATMRYSVQ